MEVRQIEYGCVLLWAKLLVLEGRKRSTSIGLFFFPFFLALITLNAAGFPFPNILFDIFPLKFTG